jgi:hypothetical protein
VSLLLVVTGSRNLNDHELMTATLREHAEPAAHLLHGGNGVRVARIVVGLAPVLYDTPVRAADAQADRAWRRHLAGPGQLGPVTIMPARWSDPCGPQCHPGRRRRVAGRDVCPAAGPRRNQAMIERAVGAAAKGWKVRVLAFPRGASRGTRGTMALATTAGLNVVTL